MQGESFKLAWMEERKAHQKDAEAAAAAAALAAKETAAEVSAAKAAQARAEAAVASNERQLIALREEAEASRRATEEMNAQLKSAQRQLARARAEKGALCEEFSQRLLDMGVGGSCGQPPSNSTATAQLNLATCLGATAGGNCGGSSSSSSALAAEGGADASALSGYEALSAFNDAGSLNQLALAIREASAQQQQLQLFDASATPEVARGSQHATAAHRILLIGRYRPIHPKGCWIQQPGPVGQWRQRRRLERDGRSGCH